MLKLRFISLILFYTLLLSSVRGQDSITYNTYPTQSKRSEKAVKSLSNSIQKNQSDEEIADNYMQLAKELSAQNDLKRSETYINQAINLYSKSKNKDKEPLATAYRELAKVQEAQQKFDDAIASFTKAARTTRQKRVSEINLNDVKRLTNRSDLNKQSSLIERNIQLSEEVEDHEEVALSFQQLAAVKLEMEDTEGAAIAYESALENVKEIPEAALEIKKGMVQAYSSDAQYEKAAEISHEIIQTAQQISDPILEIEQLQNLAQNYYTAHQTEEAISSLQQAYELAIANANTSEAGKIVTQLSEYYQASKKTSLILPLYKNFVAQLDNLIQRDSALIDTKVFQLHEEKITQLENERSLKDKLIRKTRRFNYVLLGSIFLILIFLFFIARALRAIHRKNKRIALQSLRREMNPHFIFNSLNSVNQFIAQHQELEANKYLSSYSKLMRNTMENSNKDFILLSKELEQLKEYLDLESLRFEDHFSYQIVIDDSLDTEAFYIPNMLIQPQLENAIWHGLRYKEEKGYLKLSVYAEGTEIIALIEDNGIGITKSKELKTVHQKKHQSRGLQNTKERILLLNQLYKLNISFDIREKDESESESGVIVRFSFPQITKRIELYDDTSEDNQRNR